MEKIIILIVNTKEMIKMLDKYTMNLIERLVDAEEERNEILKEINISLQSLSEHGIDIGGEIATSIIQYKKDEVY